MESRIPSKVQNTYISPKNNLLQEIIDHLMNPTSTASHMNPIIPNITLAYYSNGKYKKISCKPIQPPYDESKDALLPFLTRLDIQHQNERCGLATYITIEEDVNNVTTHSTTIKEEEIMKRATERWSKSIIDLDKHTLGHQTSNSRLLSIVLFGSMTEAS
jgi:hypothetical protein